MTELIVFCEGKTEERFIDRVVRPVLRHLNVSTRNFGGRLKFERVKKSLRNTLREPGTAYVTTFIDLYALPKDFPDFAATKTLANPLLRVAKLEAAFQTRVVAAADCRKERFLPHIQPYEFESLLFADVDQVAQRYPGWSRHVEPLHKARRKASSPEHINDGPHTHPSMRLAALASPAFDKPLDGPAVAQAIGIARLRSECAHFSAWLKRLERLRPLR